MTQSGSRASASPAAGTQAHKCLLMIAYYFQENLSGAQRPFRFAKYLARQGYEAQVITAAGQGQLKPWQSLTVAPVGEARHPWASRSCALLQKLLPYNDQMQWLPHAIGAAADALRRHSYDVVLSTSPPLVTHLAALYLKRRYGVRWVADLRDPIYGNPFRTRRAGLPYDRLLEKCIVSEADAILANTDVEWEQLRNRHARHANKIHLIWNGYDPDEILDAQPIPPRARRVVIHTGGLYGARHPGALVESLQRLRKAGKLDGHPICLRLVGNFYPRDEWVGKVHLEKLQEQGWLECLPAMPRHEAQKQMREADFLLLLDLNEMGSVVQVPAKLFEYIRVGRPILAFTAPGSPAQRILERSGISHVCITPGASPSEIDFKILTFLSLTSRPSPPSLWFTQHFSTAGQAFDLSNILEGLGEAPNQCASGQPSVRAAWKADRAGV